MTDSVFLQRYRNAVTGTIPVMYSKIADIWPNVVKLYIKGSNPGLYYKDVITYENNGIKHTGEIVTQQSGSSYSGGTMVPIYILSLAIDNPSIIGNREGGVIYMSGSSGLTWYEPSDTVKNNIVSNVESDYEAIESNVQQGLVDQVALQDEVFEQINQPVILEDEIATPPVKAEDVVKYEDPMEASFAPAGMDLKKLGLFALAGVAIAYMLKRT